MKKNGRKYRRAMDAWNKCRAGRKKPVASKRQLPLVRRTKRAARK
jgi:hypothetical protein|tara:strand:+ start:439 stop:573 length:135 start_codon:yes stop_codon:yes gene_type:complete